MTSERNVFGFQSSFEGDYMPKLPLIPSGGPELYELQSVKKKIVQLENMLQVMLTVWIWRKIALALMPKMNHFAT